VNIKDQGQNRPFLLISGDEAGLNTIGWEIPFEKER
jgi:hypothetical protein